MGRYVSPGSYFIEVDISDYPPSVNSSVVGIVGFASKGPIAGLNEDKATLITSQENLVSIFGKPNESIPGQGLEGALEILEATNSLYYVRCVGDDAVEASAQVPLGFCPAVHVSGTPYGMAAIGTEDSGVSSCRFTITAYDHDGVKTVDNKTFTVASATVASSTLGGTTNSALRKVMGGSLDGDRFGAFGHGDTSSYLVGLGAGSAAYMTAQAEIYNGTAWVGAPILAEVNASGAFGAHASSVTCSGGSFDATSINFFTKALYAGDGYNEGTTLAGDTSGNSVEVDPNGGSNILLSVNNDGTAIETFKAGVTSGSFLETAIKATVADATSDYIVGYLASGTTDLDVTGLANFSATFDNIGVAAAQLTAQTTAGSQSNATARFVKPVKGTYSLAGGNSDYPLNDTEEDTQLIGTIKTDGGRTGIEALDNDDIPVKIALVPGFSENDSTQNALVTKAESTQKFLALVSPPVAIGRPQDAIDWTNGQSTERTAALNSSYAACYWPWVKTFSVFDGKDRWFAPEIYAARQMCVTDAVSRPWFAAAGLARGRLTKPVDVEVVLNQGDRDSLYSGGNIVNPITKFTQDGIVIFGQRTTQRKATALDRVNVRRLLIDLRDTIIRTTRQFAFEPNDRFTWDRIVTTVEPLLDGIRRERGITEFKVICDETTNTPLRVDRNELWCKVLLKPTKTAEIVIFEVNVTNQSAQIGN